MSDHGWIIFYLETLQIVNKHEENDSKWQR